MTIIEFIHYLQSLINNFYNNDYNSKNNKKKTKNKNKKQHETIKIKLMRVSKNQKQKEKLQNEEFITLAVGLFFGS